MSIRLSTYHSKYAEEFIKSNRHLYNPAKHIININKVDWDDFAYKGVDLYEIDKDMMDDLLSGRLTNIIQLKYCDVKLRIYKDEHGKLTNIVIPANSECYIPDKIFNYTLSAEEKECLRSRGRLDTSGSRTKQTTNIAVCRLRNKSSDAPLHEPSKNTQRIQRSKTNIGAHQKSNWWRRHLHSNRQNYGKSFHRPQNWQTNK